MRAVKDNLATSLWGGWSEVKEEIVWTAGLLCSRNAHGFVCLVLLDEFPVRPTRLTRMDEIDQMNQPLLDAALEPEPVASRR